MAEFSGRDANVAIVQFLTAHGSALPEKPLEKLQEAVADTDGLAAIITAIEALYSVPDLGEPGLELLRDLSEFAGRVGFYGQAARWNAIHLIALRRLDGGDAEADGDPELDARFAPPPEPAEPEATPARPPEA